MKKKHIDYTNWSKDELVKELKRIKETTYGLVWHRDVPQEKIDVLINPDARTPEEMFANEVAGKPFPVLKEVKGKEVISNKDDQTHILIEGDNYHSLAVLNFTHREAIDVIYIDPPYNTGNKDFIYTDRYKSDYVIKDDPFRHSKWLTFMEKRLNLARNLLKETGVVFISIDDNEVSQLKMLCDEIFDEKNYVSQLIIQSNPRGSQSSKHFASVHEYVLVYAKSIESFNIDGFEKEEKNLKEYSSIDAEGRKYRLLGLRQRGGEWKRSQRPNMYYPVYVNPKNGGVSLEKTKEYYIESLPKRPTGEDGRWTWSKGKFEKSGSLLIGKKVKRDGDDNFYDIFRKDYLLDSTGNQLRSKPKTIWIEKELNYQNGRNEIKDIFNADIFDYPKPTFLIKKIIRMFDDKDISVLDFMAGSGTTGHAVLDLNKEDGGTRKFILCTNNENKIATDVCQPRLEKVIKGYKNNKGEKIEGLGGNLKYYTAYDFVESEPSDKNKHKLVNKCTEMLCIKEGIYDLVTETNDYKILKSHDGKHLGIIFYEDAIDEYKKAIKKIDGSINTYVFSLGDDPHTAQFADVTDKVVLQAIPEIILKVYQEIFR